MHQSFRKSYVINDEISNFKLTISHSITFDVIPKFIIGPTFSTKCDSRALSSVMCFEQLSSMIHMTVFSFCLPCNQRLSYIWYSILIGSCIYNNICIIIIFTLCVIRLIFLDFLYHPMMFRIRLSLYPKRWLVLSKIWRTRSLRLTINRFFVGTFFTSRYG